MVSSLDWVTLVIMGANVVLVLVTGWYAYLTHQLVNETRKARVAMDQAVIVVDMIRLGGLLVLKVSNIGRRPATDISIKPSTPIYNSDDQEITVFRSIAGLGPGEERRYIVDAGFKYFEKGRPDEIVVEATWTDSLVGRLTASCQIDVGSYRHAALLSTEEERYHDGMLKKLDSIIKALGR